MGHECHVINEKFVGNEQKLVFTMQKFSQMVGVRAKKGRECQRKESYTFRHYLNVRYHFPKSFETTSGSLKSASGSQGDPRVSGLPSLHYSNKDVHKSFILSLQCD